MPTLRRSPSRAQADRQRRTRGAQSVRVHFAASEHDADILYPTGFLAPDAFLFVQLGSRRLIVVGDVELDRARAHACVDRVLPWSSWARRLEARGESPHAAAVIGAVLRELGVLEARVPFAFPLGLARALARRGIRLTPAADPFWPEREIKRPAEVRAITAALRAAEAGIQAAIERLRECRIAPDGLLRFRQRPVSAEDLRALVNCTVMAHGAVPAHTICAPGDQAVDPHESGSGPLRAHQSIVIDVFPRSDVSGYYGDVTRTVVRGQASERLREMYAAVSAAVRLGKRRIRPGVDGRRLHREIARLFEQRGFRTGEIDGRMQGFFHGTGHGLGLEIHEAPSISERRPSRLRARQVATVEPGLYYLGLGGVRIEDLVVVTRTGCRTLTRLPQILEI